MTFVARWGSLGDEKGILSAWLLLLDSLHSTVDSYSVLWLPPGDGPLLSPPGTPPEEGLIIQWLQ